MIDREKITKLIATNEGYEYLQEGYGFTTGHALIYLPSWLDDLSAAVKLLDRITNEWQIQCEGRNYVCTINNISAAPTVKSRACVTPAYAVCDLYLTYFEINESWVK